MSLVLRPLRDAPCGWTDQRFVLHVEGGSWQITTPVLLS